MAHNKAFVVAVYCYTRAIRTYLRQEPLTHFSYAGPFYGNLCFWAAFWSRDFEHSKNIRV